MNNNKGFSLLEILVAFSILAISLGILLKIFSTGVNTAVAAEEYTVATQLAESLMTKTGVETPLNVGESSGEEDEKYRWQITINNYIDDAVDDDEASAYELMSVQVTVEWGDESENSRIVELNSVKIRPKQ